VSTSASPTQRGTRECAASLHLRFSCLPYALALPRQNVEVAPRNPSRAMGLGKRQDNPAHRTALRKGFRLEDDRRFSVGISVFRA
jgi:hypothetical protein